MRWCLSKFCWGVVKGGANLVVSCRDGVREHARNHEQQEQVTECYYTTVSLQSGGCDETCIYQDKEKHYHCNWVS